MDTYCIPIVLYVGGNFICLDNVFKLKYLKVLNQQK